MTLEELLLAKDELDNLTEYGSDELYFREYMIFFDLNINSYNVCEDKSIYNLCVNHLNLLIKNKQQKNK